MFLDLEMNVHVFIRILWSCYGEEQHPAIIYRANQKWTCDYHEQLIQEAQENTKLKFYSKITENRPFGFKDYLDQIPNRNKRFYLTRMGCGSHRLRVEIERWTRIPHLLRECRFCDSKVVEDEEHVILDCDGFTNERKHFFEKICSIIPNFMITDRNEKLRLMFMDELELPKITQEFISEISMRINEKYMNWLMNQLRKNYCCWSNFGK